MVRKVVRWKDAFFVWVFCWGDMVSDGDICLYDVVYICI